MTKLKKLSSLALTIAVVLFGMALSAGTAQAAIITFGVDENVVPGATGGVSGVDFTANGLTGKYRESVVTTGGASGTFTGSILVGFSAYTIGGNPVNSQIGALGADTPANLYVLYAIVTVSGNYFTSLADDSGDGINDTLVTHFVPTASTAAIYVDPSRNDVGSYTVPSVADGGATITSAGVSGSGGDDLLVLSASTIVPFPSSNGSVEQCLPGFCGILADFAVTGGKYALVYSDPTLSAFGQTYWPDLSQLQLAFAIASGDVDPALEGSVFPTDVKGDTSISFINSTPVPEPASLFLLGSGLMGVAGWRRRRTATN